MTSYFVVGGNLGYAIGPVFAGALVGWLGLPGLLLIVIPALVMVLALRYLFPGGLVGICIRGAKPELSQGAVHSKWPFVILMTASILRAWAISVAITFLPMYLVTQGYTLVMASVIMTLMLLSGVAGQVFGGQISDRYGKKEFMVFGLIASIPAFCLFFFTTGLLSIAGILLFGFALWSTLAVAVAMSHELLPENVGLASGIMLGMAIGFGGLGVAVNSLIADHYSLVAALGPIPVPIAAAVLLMFLLPYPWKCLQRRISKNEGDNAGFPKEWV
jgi:FSR family fosmidomycin resistance protein-like MFS transporter